MQDSGRLLRGELKLEDCALDWAADWDAVVVWYSASGLCFEEDEKSTVRLRTLRSYFETEL